MNITEDEAEQLLMFTGDAIRCFRPRRKRLNKNQVDQSQSDNALSNAYNERDKLIKAAIGYLVSSLKRVAVILCNNLIVDQLKDLESDTLQEIILAAENNNVVQVMSKMQFSVHNFCDVCTLLQVNGLWLK